MTKEQLKALSDNENALEKLEKSAGGAATDAASATASAAAAAGRVDRERDEWQDADCPEALYVESALRKSANERPYFGASHQEFAAGDPCEYSFSLSDAVEKTYSTKSPLQLIALIRLGVLKAQQLVSKETGVLKNPKAFMIGINGSTAKSKSTAQAV